MSRTVEADAVIEELGDLLALLGLERSVMFMRVNAKCAHQVRPRAIEAEPAKDQYYGTSAPIRRSRTARGGAHDNNEPYP